MQLSNVNEDKALPRKLFLGLENFQATAVNPTLVELQAMGIPATTEPEYVTTVKRDYGEGEKEYEAVNIRVYLDNMDPKNPIRTQVNYQIIKANHLSSTNKFKVINKYGSSTWLEEGAIGGTLPTNMHWYVNDGVKKCYRGEDNLIDFIKAYRNLPNINVQSKQDIKDKGIAVFTTADLDKMFTGDFKDIRDAIMSVGNKGMVGFMMGVRHLEDKDVQTLYRQTPLKRYIKKTNKNEYLVKDIISSQENGAYADVTFDLASLALKEYSAEDKVTADDMDAVTADYDDNDDLPF